MIELIGSVILSCLILAVTLLKLEWERRMHPQTLFRKGLVCFCGKHEFEIFQRLSSGYARVICKRCDGDWEQCISWKGSDASKALHITLKPWTQDTTNFYASMHVRLRPRVHAKHVSTTEIQRN